MLSGLRDAAVKHLPPSMVRFVRDRKLEWRDRSAVRAFSAVSASNPLVLYCIGARGGADGMAGYFRRQGKLKLVAFEPEPDEATRLSGNESFDYMIPCGLGNETGRRMLNVTKSPGCSSILEPHTENLQKLCEFPEWFRVERQVPVDLVRLDEVVRERQLPPPDMLEIDTQGFEFEVLEGCGALLAGVSALVTELQFYPTYRGQKSFAEVQDWLRSQGFYLALVKRNGYYGHNLVEVNACFYNRNLVERSARSAAALEFWKARYAGR